MAGSKSGADLRESGVRPRVRVAMTRCGNCGGDVVCSIDAGELVPVGTCAGCGRRCMPPARLERRR